MGHPEGPRFSEPIHRQPAALNVGRVIRANEIIEVIRAVVVHKRDARLRIIS